MLCGLCFTLTFGIVYSYSDFFIPLQQEFGWNAVQDSTIPAVSLIVFSFGSLIGGSVIRKLGWRSTCILGSCLTGLGIAFSSQVSNYDELLVLFGIVFSLGNAFTVLCTGPLVVKWFLKRRGLAVGVTSAGSGVGTLTIPPIAEYFISTYGWRISFLLIGLFFLVLLLGVSYFMRTPEENEMFPYGWNNLSIEEKRRFQDSLNLRQALGTSRYWMIFVMFFLGTVGVTMFVVHASPFGLTEGIDQFYASIALGILGAGSLIGRIVMGSVSDKISRGTTVSISLFSELIGLAIVPFVSGSIYLFFISGLAIGFGYGGYLADFISLIGDLYGSESVANVWGFTEVSYGLGGLVGPIIAAAYFSRFGTYIGIFEIAALGLLAALVISIFFSRQVGRMKISQVI